MKQRIQKVLAQAGIASRRSVEEMIIEGRIVVNSKVVTSLPCFVEPDDEILLDGRTIRKKPQRKVYYLVNKARGVICTQKDVPGQNRPRAVDMVPAADERIYCLSALDEDATGLVILTNDGELTNRLTHPRYGVIKTYIVRAEGRIQESDLAELRRGMFIDGRKATIASARIIRQGVQESMIEVKLTEARNRQVRRMLARIGHEVVRLHRMAIGPITDRGVKIGHYRILAHDEIEALRRAAGDASGGGVAEETFAEPYASSRGSRPGRRPSSRATGRPPTGRGPRRTPAGRGPRRAPGHSNRSNRSRPPKPRRR